MDNGSQPSGRGAGGAGGATVAVSGSTRAANRRVNKKFFANSGSEAPF